MENLRSTGSRTSNPSAERSSPSAGNSATRTRRPPRISHCRVLAAQYELRAKPRVQVQHLRHSYPPQPSDRLVPQGARPTKYSFAAVSTSASSPSSSPSPEWTALSSSSQSTVRLIAHPISLGFSEREVARMQGVTVATVRERMDVLREEIEGQHME